MKLLGTASAQKPGKVGAVTLLGRDQRLQFQQGADGLRVSLPTDRPATANIGIALKVHFV